MNLRYAIVPLLLSAASAALAQRRLVVADVETSLPVGGVSVQSLHGVQVTDSAGLFTAPDSVATLVLSHVNYESRIVSTADVRDTVFIISRLLSLREVVVFGRGKLDDDQLRQLRRQLRMARTEAQLLQADPGQGLNVLGLLSHMVPKKWRQGRSEKRRRRHEQILRDY